MTKMKKKSPARSTSTWSTLTVYAYVYVLLHFGPRATFDDVGKREEALKIANGIAPAARVEQQAKAADNRLY